MTLKYVTQVVMVLGIALWIGWDLVVATNREKGDTISEITLAISMMAPVLPFAVGFLAGHLFGGMEWVRPAVAFVKANPLLPFLVGVPSGMLFWSQVGK
jgi:hypothetical protein